jgi:hypothetical protein
MTTRTGSVTGVRETLAELGDVDRKYRLAAIAKMKTAAKPLAQAAEGYFPPVSPFAGRSRDGWSHGGRTGWKGRPKVVVRVETRKPRRSNDRQDWPLVRVVLDDGQPAAAAMYDLAGAGSLGDELDAEYGGRSRAMWRAADSHRDACADAVRDAIREVSARVNRRLVEGP